ncbi:MAG: hypothetical protein AAFR34_05510 [Pseudomonadota bacterium]
MPIEPPVTPGQVDWTGENPGILLKHPDGSNAAMALFFRIAWSPVGQGQALLLYGTPDLAEGTAEAPNILLSDNEALGEFLRDNFVARLAGFSQIPPFEGLAHKRLRSVRTSGDPMRTRYTETVVADGLTVELVWEGLEPPKALELPPEMTGTKAHTMFSLLVPAREAAILVNGWPLAGTVGTRVQAGFETTTAFLYFSETWVFPPEPA